MTTHRAIDVAAYILTKTGPLPAYSLQKLLYFAQCWCRAETGRFCFDDTTEAWVNGPVVRSVWLEHKHQKQVFALPGDATMLQPTTREVVDDVLDVYAGFSSEQLVEATHAEPAWLIARNGMDEDQRTDTLIALDSTVHYYRTRSQGLLNRKERMRKIVKVTQLRSQMTALMKPHKAALARLA